MASESPLTALAREDPTALTRLLDRLINLENRKVSVADRARHEMLKAQKHIAALTEHTKVAQIMAVPLSDWMKSRQPYESGASVAFDSISAEGNCFPKVTRTRARMSVHVHLRVED